MVGRHGADERDVDSLRRRSLQRVEDSWLEGEMADFRANAEAAKETHGGRKLRKHQIIDRPIFAACWRNPDLANQDRFADSLDAPVAGRSPVMLRSSPSGCGCRSASNAWRRSARDAYAKWQAQRPGHDLACTPIECLASAWHPRLQPHDLVGSRSVVGAQG